MDDKLPLAPLPLPPSINAITTRAWLERHIKTRLEKLMLDHWGYKPPRIGVRNQNPLFLDARASVAASFYNDLCSGVLDDVFKNRRTMEPHQAYLNTLKSGNFEIKLQGKFDEEKAAALSGAIYELGRTCAEFVETLPLPHIKKPTLTAPAVDTTHPAITPTRVGGADKPSLSEQEQAALKKLEDHIANTVKLADSKKIEEYIVAIKGKSKQLGAEIEALSALTPSQENRHNIYLKQKHQDVILDGLNLAEARKRELTPPRTTGAATAPIAAPEPITPQPVFLAQPEAPRVSARVGLRQIMAGLRRHVAAAALGFAAAATGVTLAVNMTGNTPKPPAAPLLTPTFVAAATAPAKQALPVAAQAVLPAASANMPTAVTVPVVAEHAVTESTAASTVSSVVTKASMTKEWNAPRPVTTHKPAKVSGVAFTYATDDTLRKMCDEMRLRNIQTWACEQQPQ